MGWRERQLFTALRGKLLPFITEPKELNAATQGIHRDTYINSVEKIRKMGLVRVRTRINNSQEQKISRVKNKPQRKSSEIV